MKKITILILSMVLLAGFSLALEDQEITDYVGTKNWQRVANFDVEPGWAAVEIAPVIYRNEVPVIMRSVWMINPSLDIRYKIGTYIETESQVVALLKKIKNILRAILGAL